MCTFDLRYVGARFDNARLPVEFLPDLQAFRDLLLAFARDHWRSQNQKRERLPKGFDKSISLDLVALKSGSAIPQLEWRRDVAQKMLPDFTDEIEDAVKDAFNEIILLFDNAGQNNFPRTLPPQQIRALNKFGANLREGERIELSTPSLNDGVVVYIDSYRRKSILTNVTETYETRYEGIGELIANNINGLVKIRTPDKGDLEIQVQPERIPLDFDGSLGATVQFAIQIELDHSDNFRGITEVFGVELVDPDMADGLARCHERLNTLRSLKNGWHSSEEGEPVSDLAHTACRSFLGRRASRSKEYRIFPTIEGGLLIEFIANGWDNSVEFKPDGGVDFFGVELEGDGEFGPETFSKLDDDFYTLFDKKTGKG